METTSQTTSEGKALLSIGTIAIFAVGAAAAVMVIGWLCDACKSK